MHRASFGSPQACSELDLSRHWRVRVECLYRGYPRPLLVMNHLIFFSHACGCYLINVNYILEGIVLKFVSVCSRCVILFTVSIFTR